MTGLRLTTASATSSTPRGTRIRAATSLRITAAPSGRGLRRPILAVQALAQLLAGLEEGHELVLDEDGVAGARIAALPGGAVLHREGAEAAQLDPVTASQRASYFIEHDVDDALDVALKQVRVGRSHALNQFRLDHACPTFPAS